VKSATAALAFTFLVATPLAVPAQSNQDPVRKIEPVAGDVYRFQNNFHYALVVVTDEGVVVVDPINAEASTWLKAELGKMTDQPVTHLIYSHSHLDHASGGSVFADGTTVIAQENAPADIDGVVPTERFSDTTTLEIGGKTLELTYLGPGHGQDMIAVVVRPENVGFITDVAVPRRLPYRTFGGASNIDDWIDQIETVETLDFEILAPAHGNVGTKEDATEVRVYIETLRAEVLEGLRDGKSVDVLVEEVTMDDYVDWAQYDRWRGENVQGMAKFLSESGQVE
jgi:glyoxylase-like metal-dependent hydrolase (beta-lactamase superfamily II)